MNVKSAREVIGCQTDTRFRISSVGQKQSLVVHSFAYTIISSVTSCWLVLRVSLVLQLLLCGQPLCSVCRLRTRRSSVPCEQRLALRRQFSVLVPLSVRVVHFCRGYLPEGLRHLGRALRQS